MGSQEPSVRIVPEHVDSDGADAVKVLRTGQLSVDPWQANVLEDWMGRTEEGLWSAPSCGESVPRQNGKTLDTVGRMASGMILYAEWIVYTAHLQKTATETFMEIKGLFEPKGLVKYVKEIKSAIGREQIFLKNGGRVVFVARTRNGGRGLHGDCLVLDEAQGVTIETAEIADLPEYGEVAKALNGAWQQGINNMPGVVQRMTKQMGADSTLKNALRDGAQFAWIPGGDTCAFCITLASRGWQNVSKKTLRNGHAEHIHAHCDCQYAVRFDKNSNVEGYNPDKYLDMYYSAEGKKPKEKINFMRRARYAESLRRKIGDQGQEIIDKPTYNKLTKKFLRNGGIIIRGEDARKHLESQNAYASYMIGGNFAFIRDDATISDVLEEMYHAEQDRQNIFSNYPDKEILLRREIEAQKYLISVVEKYKIPLEQTKVTQQNLARYETRLKEIIQETGGSK